MTDWALRAATRTGEGCVYLSGVLPLQGELLRDATAEIKESVEIVDVINDHVRLEPSGGKFRGLCPFHDDHRPSFFVDPQFRNYRCWSCGAKGDVFSFLQQIEGISFADAKRKLAERAGITLEDSGTNRSDTKQSIYRVLSWAQEKYHNCLFDARTGAEARQYLEERGLTLETARVFGLGYAPAGFEWLVHQAANAGVAREALSEAGLTKVAASGRVYDTFRGRLMVPIRDEHKRVLGFGGRILPVVEASADQSSFAGPKYLNTASTVVYNKSEVLYGLDVAIDALRQQPRKQPRFVVVMEGYTDCLMAYQAGLRTAVAVCGTALTARHVAKLRSTGACVILMFDGDESGQKAAREATSLFLTSEVDLRLCVLPAGNDPCDFIRQKGIDALKGRMDDAVDPLEYQIEQARKRFDTATIEGRRLAVESVLQTLGAVPELPTQSLGIKFQLALSRLTENFGIEESQLRSRIKDIRRRRGAPAALTQRGDERREPAMGKLEREVVQLLAAQPGRAGELQSLFPADNVEHPVLKRLTEAIYALHAERGNEATTLDLRERLDDTQLNGLVIEMCDQAPSGEEFEQGLRDMQSTLQQSEHRSRRGEARRRLASSVNQQNYLETLRQLRDLQAR